MSITIPLFVAALVAQDNSQYMMSRDEGIPWVETGQTAEFHSYLDPTTVRTLPDGRKLAWVMIESKKPDKDGVTRSMARERFDCAEETVTLLALNLYSASGKPLMNHVYRDGSQAPSSAPPGSIHRGALDRVCLP